MNLKARIEKLEMYLDEINREVPKIIEELEVRKEESRRSQSKLTNREAARILGVHETTIIRMKNDGRLPSTKVKDIIEYQRRKR